jgi:hypothetical protein
MASSFAFMERWVTMLLDDCCLCAEGPWFLPGSGLGNGLKLYYYKCVPLKWWMGKTKYLKCLWTGYCSRCQAHQFECINNLNAAGFFMLNSFPCVSIIFHPPRTSSQLWEVLESTWTSIPVECLTLCRVHALTNWGWSEDKKGVQSNIRKVFLKFFTLSVLLWKFTTKDSNSK